MRGFCRTCAVLATLACTGAAGAADSHAAPTAPASAATGIRAVVAGLRQTLFGNGLSRAFSRAGDWVKELELSWTAHSGERTALGLDTAPPAAAEVETPTLVVALTPQPGGFVSHRYTLDFGPVSFGAGGSEDQVWALGHAQPIAALTMTGGSNPIVGREGAAASERALLSHDLEIGLRLPMLPWHATIAGDHYWWGETAFGRAVQGSRIALRLSPAKNVEIEGGRADDTRGAGDFVGMLYRVPLDQAK